MTYDYKRFLAERVHANEEGSWVHLRTALRACEAVEADSWCAPDAGAAQLDELIGDNEVAAVVLRRPTLAIPEGVAHYLAACAWVFPHVNVGEDGELGCSDDTPGAWCLGCTILEHLGEYTEIFFDDDEDKDSALRFIAEFEAREAES